MVFKCLSNHNDVNHACTPDSPSNEAYSDPDPFAFEKWLVHCTVQRRGPEFLSWLLHVKWPFSGYQLHEQQRLPTFQPVALALWEEDTDMQRPSRVMLPYVRRVSWKFASLQLWEDLHWGNNQKVWDKDVGRPWCLLQGNAVEVSCVWTCLGAPPSHQVGGHQGDWPS